MGLWKCIKSMHKHLLGCYISHDAYKNKVSIDKLYQKLHCMTVNAPVSADKKQLSFFLSLVFSQCFGIVRGF